MSKYRITKVSGYNNSESFHIEKKFLFLWKYVNHFPSIIMAERAMDEIVETLQRISYPKSISVIRKYNIK